MAKQKKPPDDKKKDIPNEQIYRMIKCPLKSVLKNYDIVQPIIENAVKDVNKFVITGYQFIRLFLLNKFTNNQELPVVNKQFVLDILKTIGSSETNRGKQTTESKIKNKNIKDEIKLFYVNTFSKLIDEKLSYSNKTFILEQTANEMITCIETNISTHFIKHLFKYINCLFRDPKKEIIKKEKDKKKEKRTL